MTRITLMLVATAALLSACGAHQGVPVPGENLGDQDSNKPLVQTQDYPGGDPT